MIKKNVLIVGCGALGCSLAAMLSSVAAITVYDRGERTRRIIRRRGIFLKEGRKAFHARAEVVDHPRELSGRLFDLIIITTKVAGVRAAAELTARYARAKNVFFPQNGIFDLSWATDLFRSADISRGVATIACREAGAGRVEIAFRGKVFAGGAGARKIAALFARAGVRSAAVADPRRAVWAKLIFNAVMNPLPVITGRGYDILKEDAAVYGLARRAILEGKRLAAAEGVRLAFDPMRAVDGIRLGRYGVIRHMGSTYTDVMSGRPTEMCFMTGALLEIARRHRIAVPALTGISSAFADKTDIKIRRGF